MGLFPWDDDESPSAKVAREATEADIRQLLLEQEQEGDDIDNRDGVQAILGSMFREEDVERVRRALRQERELLKNKDPATKSIDSNGHDNGKEATDSAVSKLTDGKDKDGNEDEDPLAEPRSSSFVMVVKAAAKFKIKASDNKSVADQMKSEASIRVFLADKDEDALKNFDPDEVGRVRQKIQQEIAILKALDEEEKHAPPRPPPPPIVIPDKKEEDEHSKPKEEPFNLFGFLTPPPPAAELENDKDSNTIAALQAEIDQLKQQLVLLTSPGDTSKANGDDKVAPVTMSQDEQYLVANKVSSLEAAVADKQQELSHAQETIAALGAQLKDEQAKKIDTPAAAEQQQRHETVAKTQSELETSIQQVTALQADLENAKAAQIQAAATQAKAQETIETLKETVQTLEREKEQQTLKANDNGDKDKLFEQLQSENQMLRQETERLAKDVAHAQDKASESTQSGGEADAQAAELQEEKQAVEAALQKTQQELEKATKQVESLQADSIHSEQTLKDLREMVDTLRAEKAAMQLKSGNNETENGSAMQALEDKKKSLEQKVSELESQLAGAPSKATTDELQVKIDQLMEEKVAMANELSENCDKDNTIRGLEDEKTSLQARLLQFESQRAEAPSKETLEELEQVMQQLKQEKMAMAEELELAKISKPDEDKLHALQEEKASLDSKVTNLEFQLSEAVNTKESLEQALAEAQKLEKTVASLKEQLAEAPSKEKLEELELVMEQLKQEKFAMAEELELAKNSKPDEDKLHALQEEKASLDSKVTNLEFQLSEAVNTKESLEQALAEAQKLEKTVASLKEQLAEAPSKEKLEELELVMEQLKQEKFAMAEELELAKNSKPDEDKLHALQEEKALLDSKVTNFEFQLSEAVDTKESLEQALAEAQKLEKTVASLKEQLAEAPSKEKLEELELVMEQLKQEKIAMAEELELAKNSKADEDKLRALQEEKASLDIKVTNLEFQLSEAVDTKKSLEQAFAEAQKFEEIVASLKEQLAAAPSKENVEKLEQAMEQLKQEKWAMTQELELAKNTKPDEDKIQSLEADKASLDSKVTDLEFQLSEAVETKKSLEQALTEAQKLEDTVACLKENMASLDQDKQSVLKEKEALQQLLSTKETDLRVASEARDSLQASCQAAEALAKAATEERTEMERNVQLLERDLNAAKLALDEAAPAARDVSNPADE